MHLAPYYIYSIPLYILFPFIFFEKIYFSNKKKIYLYLTYIQNLKINPNGHSVMKKLVTKV